MWSRAGIGLAAQLRHHLPVHHHAPGHDHLLGVAAAGNSRLRQNLLQPLQLCRRPLARLSRFVLVFALGFVRSRPPRSLAAFRAAFKRCIFRLRSASGPIRVHFACREGSTSPCDSASPRYVLRFAVCHVANRIEHRLSAAGSSPHSRSSPSAAFAAASLLPALSVSRRLRFARASAASLATFRCRLAPLSLALRRRHLRIQAAAFAFGFAAAARALGCFGRCSSCSRTASLRRGLRLALARFRLPVSAFAVDSCFMGELPRFLLDSCAAR